MEKIKTYLQFINEELTGEEKLKAVGRSLIGNLLSGKQFATGGFGTSSDSGVTTIGSPSGSTSTSTSTTTGSTSEPLTSVPGNDEFMLYMQHQQGMAGAKALISAMLGQGKLHPDTVKTKSGVRYANLVANIPKDRPQVKQDMIKALDAGDHKTAATLFLKMWKEKWNSKSAAAKVDINKPQNAEVKSLIQKYSSQFGVPYDFAITVAIIESSFNPKSGNNRYKGVYALSQEEFKKYVPGGDIYNANDNIKAGIQVLKNNIRDFTRSLGPLLSKIDVGTWAKSLA